MVQKIIDTIDSLGKILGPAFLAFVLFYGGLGYGIFEMYKFNVIHKIINKFPSQFVIYFYFFATFLFAIFIVVIISIQTKIAAMAVSSPTPQNSTPNQNMPA